MMADDDHWVKLRKGRTLQLQPVSEDELRRHVDRLQGGWTCDPTQGGCGRLLVTGTPVLQIKCAPCGREWSLAGGRSDGGTGDLSVWYVPRSKRAN